MLDGAHGFPFICNAGKGNQGEALDPKYPNGRTGQIVALNGKVDKGASPAQI